MISKKRKKQKEEEEDEEEDEEEEEEIQDKEDDQPLKIEALEDEGINPSDINKLKREGYHTVISVLMTVKKNLCKIKGLSEPKVDKIIEAAMKVGDVGFTNGLELLQKRKKLLKISTGSKNLDKLLQGGIESMSITEIFGEFRTGKTQLCHTLAVTAQLPKEDGGGGGKVIYIDSEGTFRPSKIAKIAERYDLDPQEVLQNIVYARVYTTEIQDNILMLATAQMINEPFALIIVDSIMALFRVDYTGRGQLSERQQVLNQTLSKLLKLADQFNIAVLLTNQVMANPGATMSFGDQKLPIGGHILAHASTTRLYLKKGRGDERICKVYDSPVLPTSEAIFLLTEGGIDDPNQLTIFINKIFQFKKFQYKLQQKNL